MYKILHVETSNFYRKLISDITTEIKAEYFSACNIEESLEILRNNEINLIITAMELKGACSDKFIDLINDSEYKNTPIVVITGNDSAADRKKMFDLGIVDYITKQSSQEEIKYNIQAYKQEDDILRQIRDMHIAVCDDSMMDRYIIQRIFTMAGVLNVDYYESGEAMIESNIVYDVYLIDLVLKKMSGSHVVMKIRERGDEGVIILISGIDSFKTITNVLNMGSNDYITKPFNSELFWARLKTNIRSYLLLNEVRQKTKMLEKISITDALTDVFNRRHIMERLDHEIKVSQRKGTKLSILMLDVDHFKRFNDTFGHQVGDQVLIKVASHIKKSIRDIDLVGRYGGEEFLVILPDVDINSAIVIGERIRKSVMTIKSNRADFSVSISGGIQEWKGHDMGALIKEADDLLYSAKKNGRNRMES